MAEGYVYCFSNSSMPGLLKIGMTERTPEIRLGEANSSDTWRPPTPYVIEFAKKVKDPKGKENTLHILLEQYTERVSSRREFFRVSLEEARKFFDLMDGEQWEPTTKVEAEQEDDDEDDEEEDSPTDKHSKPANKVESKKPCREMSKCFADGQLIRHTIGVNKTWVGKYNASKNTIEFEGKQYKTMSEFATQHHAFYGRVRSADWHGECGWRSCECEKEGKWISTKNLLV